MPKGVDIGKWYHSDERTHKLIYIRVNNRTTPLMINYYSAEVRSTNSRSGKGGVSESCREPRGRQIFHCGHNEALAAAFETTLIDPLFDQIIKDRASALARQRKDGFWLNDLKVLTVTKHSEMEFSIWIADVHRMTGKRFVVRADEKLTEFLEAIRNSAG